MARHRDVRNRQFSYDEGEEDFHDEDEEAARACEEHRQYMLSSRGEGASGGDSGSGVSLSSYLDIPAGNTQRENQQHQRYQQTHDAMGPPGDADRQPPDRYYPPAPAANSEADPDAELVAAIAAELENRLGRGRFSADQIRQVVVSSGYEVDTAEAMLLSASEPQIIMPTPFNSPTTTPDTTTGKTAPAPGLPLNSGASPSSLAFGLSVDGQGEWGRKGAPLTGSTTALLHPAASPAALSSSSSSAAAAEVAGGTASKAKAAVVKPFGFDTLSPNDLNLFKQATARGGGGGMMSAGSGGNKNSNGGGGRSTTADNSISINSRTSPEAKAKVVHISASPAPAKGVARPGVVHGKASTAADVRSPPSRSGEHSPVRGVTPPPQQAEGEGGGDEGDADGKERLAMVVIGHVDAGKSTLMGQVLVQMGQVGQQSLHKQKKEAKEAGKASFFLAWMMDEDQEERAHGVTIEVAQKYIETETKLVTLLDAPGHRDFIPKMISGASAADAAVLVVPAAVGEFESGFQANGQTKEHAMLAKAVGVNQLLVVVNKLDVTDPAWSKERYDAIKAEVGPFLTRTSFHPKKVRFVPASGLSGENVFRRDPEGTLSSWYDGPTLLEAIDAFKAAPKATEKPFRMCVADVTSAGKGVSVSGRVVQGRVRTGDKVLMMPLEDPASVVRLERNGAFARTACAGDNAEMTLSGVDVARVVVGNVVCKAGGALPAVKRFSAQIIALPELEVPVIKGTEFQLHMHNLDVMVHCSMLISIIDTTGAVLKKRPRCVPSGSTGRIRITCSRPICIQKYGECRALGRFVLRQKGATVAVGLVLET